MTSILLIGQNMEMMKSFNVWSEFQPLISIAVGNINPIDEIDITILDHNHQDNLTKVLEYTHQDLEKIKSSLHDLSIHVEQCKTFDLRGSQGSSPPLQPRDWFMIYGDTTILPNQNKPYNEAKTKSLNHVLKNKIVNGDYTDTANYLRCGNDVFYTSDFGDQGTKEGQLFVNEQFKSINTDVKLHQIDNVGAHLDGSIFFVRPGLLLSAIPKKDLPYCLQSWDVIDCTIPEAKPINSANVWGDLFRHKHKKFHPFILEKWLWYKHTNPEETVWSINALSINEQCVMMSGYNKYVFDELKKYKIECIDLGLKSLDFWDGGLHCFTNELERQGDCVDYFA